GLPGHLVSLPAASVTRLYLHHPVHGDWEHEELCANCDHDDADQLAHHLLLVGFTNGPIPGLGWGSIGLALRLVGLQVIWVNLYGYVVTRKLGWAYDFAYQASILGFLLAMGIASRWLSGIALGRF